LEQALGKIGLKPAFSTKFKEAVPKTEVLKQPQLFLFTFYFLFYSGVGKMSGGSGKAFL
jgi:hypothetical protein